MSKKVTVTQPLNTFMLSNYGLYTVAVAAELVGVTKAAVYLKMRAGKLAYEIVDGNIYFNQAAVDKYRQERLDRLARPKQTVEEKYRYGNYYRLKNKSPKLDSKYINQTQLAKWCGVSKECIRQHVEVTGSAPPRVLQVGKRFYFNRNERRVRRFVKWLRENKQVR